MHYRKLSLLFLLFSLLLPVAPAAAQGDDHTIYVPTVRTPTQGGFVFIPDEEQVSAAQQGTTVLPCTWGKGVYVGWKVAGPGFLTTQFDAVKTDGTITTISRWFSAPSGGTIIAYMPALGSGYKWIRARWNFSGWVEYSYAVCG